jgi:hypothetical protein
VLSPEELDMSIGPVQNLGLVKEEQPASGVRPAGKSQTATHEDEAAPTLAQPGTGTQPKQEDPAVKNLPFPSELPRDEVQVQRDAQIRDEVVIKYLDTASGDLILQVPSAEVLSVNRGIYQEFQQQAKVREDAGAGAADKGEKSHGH